MPQWKEWYASEAGMWGGSGRILWRILAGGGRFENRTVHVAIGSRFATEKNRFSRGGWPTSGSYARASHVSIHYPSVSSRQAHAILRRASPITPITPEQTNAKLHGSGIGVPST